MKNWTFCVPFPMQNHSQNLLSSSQQYFCEIHPTNSWQRWIFSGFFINLTIGITIKFLIEKMETISQLFNKFSRLGLENWQKRQCSAKDNSDCKFIISPSAICTFSFRFPAVFGGFWVSRNPKTRNLETLKESLKASRKYLKITSVLKSLIISWFFFYLFHV